MRNVHKTSSAGRNDIQFDLDALNNYLISVISTF